MWRERANRLLGTEASYRRSSDDHLRDSCSASKRATAWLWVAGRRRRVVQGLGVAAEGSTPDLAGVLVAHGG